MGRMQLSLATLKDFDYGKAAVAFEKGLAAVVRDCLDRPGDKTARKVNLIAEIVPVMLQEGDVVDLEVNFTIKTSVPAWKTAARPVACTRQGQLVFNDLAPDNPRQGTLDALDEQDD